MPPVCRKSRSSRASDARFSVWMQGFCPEGCSITAMPNESLAFIPFRQPLLSACATHRPKIGRFPLSFKLPGHKSNAVEPITCDLCANWQISCRLFDAVEVLHPRV